MATPKKSKKQQNISNRLVVTLIAILVIALSIIGLMELGIVGQTLSGLLELFFGKLPQLYFAIIIIVAVSTIILYNNPPKLRWYHILGFAFFWIALELFLVLSSNPETTSTGYLSAFFGRIGPIYRGEVSSHGGIVGALLYSLSSFLFDELGTLIVAVVISIVGVLLFFNNWLDLVAARIELYRKNKKKKPKKLKKTKEKSVEIEADNFKQVDMEEALSKQEEEKKSIFITTDDPDALQSDNDYKIKETSSVAADLDDQDYQMPSLEILDQVSKNKDSQANSVSAQARGQKLLEILKQFDINAQLVDTHIGPSVTKFELKLDPGVKVNRIQSIEDNIMMELAVKEIRIEAPIPGRNAVGVEIPNIEMIPVRLSEILSSIPNELKNKKLLFGLGKDLMGQPVFGELNKMPHLLIAGATGSGKSVAVNAMITTLLMRTKPSDVKLLLIDPKKVEFTVFNDVPHLIAPVVSDPVEAAKSLRVVVNIMENRYDAFSKHGARNITSYNQLVRQDKSGQMRFMPNIVIIIDELADLMAVAGKEVETSIQRITQLARAAGIHLVVATQRPSVDVITGIIKANIPSRIAFAVSSGTDSRTILDTTGAESLLGYGDMLYVPIGEPHPTRIQGVYVSDEEVARVANYTKSQTKPRYDDAFLNLDGVEGNTGYVDATSDPLFEEVKNFVIENQKASTSLLQRNFGIGYNRGARLIDTLESQGIIGPQQGSKPRDVYVKPESEMEEELL